MQAKSALGSQAEEWNMSLLNTITNPVDLKFLAAPDLDRLAAEIRDVIISAVARNGGHLGPNLGVVELTIALHRVFSSPRDRIIFDTGHQAYAHKLLTGRLAGFAGLRKSGGLSGYPSQTESVHDLVENSHASTALSYADGFAKAAALQGQSDRWIVPVIGDGALTGGMAWEALNNIASAPGRPMVIVVNDNGRSYCPTVGGFGRAMFDALGLPCVGPVDGHDEPTVEDALRLARDLGRTCVVYCLTAKGRGYPPAEADNTDCLHSPGPFDRAVGPASESSASSGPASGSTARTWTQVFGQEMVELAARRQDLVAITAAMLHPTGLAPFAAAYPDRIFDVGIAEQHAVTSAAGLAMGGLRPVVALYSTFMNRSFDQVLMDVALHNLPVTFVLDRAGVTGPDGASHNGMWDLSLLNIVPRMRVAAPRDAQRLRVLLRQAVATADGPTAIRFPKGAAPADIEAIDTRAGMDVLADFPDGPHPPVLIVAAGAMASICLEVAELAAAGGTPVTVVDPLWVKPLSLSFSDLAARYELVAVVEDSGLIGGLGDSVARQLRDSRVDVPVRCFAIPQRFHQHASRTEVLTEAGLSPRAIADEICGLTATSRLYSVTR
jgi:1-deoxy-D-xylulose-5-phosphate synthase